MLNVSQRSCCMAQEVVQHTDEVGHDQMLELSRVVGVLVAWLKRRCSCMDEEMQGDNE